MENESFEAHRESRRDLLKKAGVGAAIVWAAPVVSSVATPAAAQTGGGDDGGGDECTQTFLIKSDTGDCTAASFAYISSDGSCDITPNATKVPSNSGACAITTSQDTDNDNGCVVSVTLPSDAQNIVAYVKQSDGCVSGTSGDLTVPTGGQNVPKGANVSISGNVVTFTKIDEYSHLNVSFCSNACDDATP